MNLNSDEEIGKAARELSDCRRELECWRTRAERFRKQMANAISILGECLKVSATKDTTKPSETDWPTYNDIVSVHNHCDDLKKRIAELEGRFRSWGVFPRD